MNITCKKRGMTRLQYFVIYIILALIIFLSLMLFINNISSGKLIEEQVLAKQIALLIDSSKPGTWIMINVGDFIVEKTGNKISVKSEKLPSAYSYEFFSSYKVEIEKQNNNLIIEIL